MSTQAENALSTEQVRETVRRFILKSITVARLDDDANLFESGIINSLFAVQLMTFVEKTFAIDVAVDDLDIENFKSVNATTAFVLRKKGLRACPHARRPRRRTCTRPGTTSSRRSSRVMWRCPPSSGIVTSEFPSP